MAPMFKDIIQDFVFFVPMPYVPAPGWKLGSSCVVIDNETCDFANGGVWYVVLDDRRVPS